MVSALRTATALLAVLSLLTGVIYPLAVTIIAHVAFPRQASGSWILEGAKVVGSELIGQPFAQPEYFWGRLSATSPHPYNAAASSGSNYGPLHPDLKQAALARITALRAWPVPPGDVPVDLVTASASGLDPDISPAAAAYQLPRVAAARKMTEDSVRKLIAEQTTGRFLGLLGEPRVNVLRLNRALDALSNGR